MRKAPFLFIGMVLFLGFWSIKSSLFVIVAALGIIYLLWRRFWVEAAAAVLLYAASSGVILFYQHNYSQYSKKFTQIWEGKRVTVIGTVSKVYKQSPMFCLIAVDSIYFLGRGYSCNVNLLVRSRQEKAVFCGRRYQIKGKVKGLQTVKSEAFREYLYTHGVHACFWSFSVIQLEGTSLLGELRASIGEFIEEQTTDQLTKAFIYALVLGDKRFLRTSQKRLFADTGTSHLLAVSGLHVGIIITLLYFLLFYTLGRFCSKRMIYIFLLIGIWFFAGITGFSASVTRSVVMATIWIFGKLFYRSVNIYNVIGGALCVLLLVNPLWVWDIGFLLSFSAVLGIVYFLPLLKHLLSVRRMKYKVVEYLVNMSLVSISAQLGTLPISLYYFESFPTYFLFTNLLAIPLLVVLVWNALFIMVTTWGVSIFQFLLKGLMSYLSFFQELPMACLKWSYDKFWGFVIALSLVSILGYGLYIIHSKYINRLGWKEVAELQV